MSLTITEITVVDTNPIVPVAAGPLAPKKPFVNKGSDDIAVYPADGSMADAVTIKAKDWDLLPPEWSSVLIRSAGDTNVYLDCAFTVVS